MTDLVPAAILERLDVFHGQLNPQQAYIYARLETPKQVNSCHLRGWVRGPANRLTRTLPTTVEFRMLEEGPDLLARTVVPDPCFWGPAEPYLYDIQIELVAESRVPATETRMFGMRMLGVHADSLFLESRPWRLQGARDTSLKDADWAAWRDVALVRRITNPSNEQCLQASQDGVMLIADLDQPVSSAGTGLEQNVLRLSKYAAVAIVTLPDEAKLTQPTRTRAPNLLVAQRCSAIDPISRAAWADLVVCESADLRALEKRLDNCGFPVLVQHTSTGNASLSEAARRCGQLAETLEPLRCVVGCLV